MPRQRRACPSGFTQHVIQRGNNRQRCFTCSLDYAYYINCLHDASLECCVDIHAWVLMTNHVHLLLTPHMNGGVSLLMQAIGRKYVRYFNDINQRTGGLWEGRFKSCLVDTDNYLLACYRYIELNPVRAKLVKSPSDYKWSSYPCNALGKPSKLVTFHPNYLALGKSASERQIRYINFFERAIPEKVISNIRKSTQKNMALGNEQFISKVEDITQRSMTPKKAGRKPKCNKS